jgi:hypothetical protein
MYTVRALGELPRFADLCIERNVRFFVGEIADRDDGKGHREEMDHVDSENEARVQEYPTIEASKVQKS